MGRILSVMWKGLFITTTNAFVARENVD